MPDSSPRLLQKGWWSLLVLALLLRAGMMLATPQLLTEDRDLYLGIATQLLSGHGYSTPGSDPPRPTAFRPPLYPLLLTVTGGNQIGIAALHLLLAGLMVTATAGTGSRRRGVNPRSLTRTGLVAGGIVAVDPLLVLYCSQPMTETLCSALSGMLLLILSQDSPGNESNHRQRVVWTISTGLLWGLCILSRPTYLVVLGIWMLSSLVFHGAEPFGPRLRRIAIVGGLALVVIAPWSVRNWLVLGKPILTTTHGGYTLWLANNPIYYSEVVEGPDPFWNGTSLDQWQKSTSGEMNRAGIVGEIAQDEWQNRRAREFIAANPGRFVRACLYRARTFWSIWPGRSADTGAPQPMLWMIAVGYAVLWMSAMAATVQVLRTGHWRRLLPAASLIIGFFIVHLVYWTDPRMRAPIMPAVALIIAVGLFSSRKESPQLPDPAIDCPANRGDRQGGEPTCTGPDRV